MPTPPALSILFDTEQPRVKRSRNAITVSGAEWDGPHFSNTWLFPEVNTLTCLPQVLRPEWHSSAASGDYARWGLSDFALSAGDGWTVHGTKDGVGQVRMMNAQGMATPAILQTDLDANRAVFVSYFPFNVGNDDAAVYLDCGFGATANYLSGVSLRFWSGGKVDVYKAGAYLATYTLGNKRGTQTANRYVDLIIMPMRGRELGVYSITTGDAFVHVFEDIAEDAADPEVTPEAPFWWYVPTPTGSPTPTAVDVEVAPIVWLDGYATSLGCSHGRPPKTGDTLEAWDNPAPFDGITYGRLFATAFSQGGDVTGLSFVELDGSTAFVPNGTRKDCRVKVELTGGTHTPFVDGAHLAYAAEIVSTSSGEDGPYDVTAWVREATLEVPDSAEPARMTLTLGYPGQLDGDIPGFLTVSNRPAQVKIGEIVIIDGVTLPTGYDDGEHDAVREAKVVIVDRMHSLRGAQLRSKMPFDGMDTCKPASSDEKFGSAVEFLYRTIGLGEGDLDLDDVDDKLPRVPSSDAGEFCHAADLGAHPFDELEQLHQDRAATFLWGIRPTATGPKALFKDPDGFSSTPDYDLYRSDDDATAAEADPDENVYFRYHEEPLEIEANETVATGWDPRTRRAIQAFAEDLGSKDPTLAPADRPDNWLGEERVFGIINRRLSRQIDCERLVEYVHPQVSARYWIGEWDSSMLFLPDGAPIWRGHLVRLHGRRDLRVSSLRVKFWREPGDVEGEALALREATYTGGTLTNAGGIGLQAIKDAHARRAVNKTVKRSGSEVIDKSTVWTVAAV